MSGADLGHRHREARRLRELLRDPAARRREGAFVLEGPRLVADALDRGYAIERVFVGPNADRAFAPLVERLRGASIEVRVLKDGVLEKVGSTRTPQPVLGVTPIPSAASLPDIAVGPVVVTAGVHDPGNLGTIVRSAEAAGADRGPRRRRRRRLEPEGRAGRGGRGAGDPRRGPGPTRGRASVGCGHAAGGWSAPTPAAPVDYESADLCGQVAIVVGGEAHGLPPELDGSVDVLVRIPMAGPTESLNVGVAASILLFEAARQARR